MYCKLEFYCLTFASNTFCYYLVCENSCVMSSTSAAFILTILKEKQGKKTTVTICMFQVHHLYGSAILNHLIYSGDTQNWLPEGIISHTLQLQLSRSLTADEELHRFNAL